MIYYLKGKVIVKEDDYLVVDVNNVGYKVFAITEEIEEGDREIALFCFTQSTEKDIRIYGFKEKENLLFFEKLINISGIGPKTALRIASIASMAELKKGIENEDKEIMKKIFSIGKKKGQQVIFELSRKFIEEEKKDEVFDALKGLGFSDVEIKEALKIIPAEEEKEKRIEKALRVLGKDK